MISRNNNKQQHTGAKGPVEDDISCFLSLFIACLWLSCFRTEFYTLNNIELQKSQMAGNARGMSWFTERWPRRTPETPLKEGDLVSALEMIAT